jgi:hypothetical protein
MRPQDLIQKGFKMIDSTYTIDDRLDAIEVRQMDHEIKQRGENQKLHEEIATLKRQIANLTTYVQMHHDLPQAAPANGIIDPRSTPPDIDRITKLRVQYFDNTKQAGQAKGITAHNLKLDVWTCPADDHNKHLNGTCGNFYFPLHSPATPKGRSRLGKELTERGLDLKVKMIGCLCMPKKLADHIAYWHDDTSLILRLGYQHDPIRLGLPNAFPQTADHSATHTWVWLPSMTRTAEPSASLTHEPDGASHPSRASNRFNS